MKEGFIEPIDEQDETREICHNIERRYLEPTDRYPNTILAGNNYKSPDPIPVHYGE